MSGSYSQSVTTYDGHIIRVVEKHQPDGRIHETAVRPPGTRIIIHRLADDHILLNREVRLDVGDDIRLPGGKVCETNTEWDAMKNNSAVDQLITQAAIREMREETGYVSTNPRLFTIATSGAPTINFDMYYFVATDFSDSGHQQLTEDEKITPTWTPIPEVVDICLSGKMQEGRSVAVLLQYLHSLGSI